MLVRIAFLVQDAYLIPLLTSVTLVVILNGCFVAFLVQFRTSKHTIFMRIVVLFFT